MKKLLLLLFTCSALFSASLFTLENVGNVNIYLANESAMVSEKQESEIKTYVTTELKKAGFVIGESDPSTFFVKIASFEFNNVVVVNLQVGLGEEVKTKRNHGIETFAFTYSANDFFDTDSKSVKADIKESLEMLVSEFLETYKEDNE